MNALEVFDLASDVVNAREVLPAAFAALAGGVLGGAVGGVLHERFHVGAGRHVDRVTNTHSVVVDGAREHFDDVPDPVELGTNLGVREVAFEVRADRPLGVNDRGLEGKDSAVDSHGAEPSEGRAS